MPFFSKLKSAKKAADKHKQAANAQTDDKPAAAPYKHVPTHAARDALSGTPDGWSTRERSAAIAAAHKRRSELDLLRASTGGDYRFDMEHNRMAHMRAANDDLSRSGSMMNMANMAYADSSRLNFTPPLSSSSSHLSLNDKYHPRPSFGRQDTGLSSGSMGRRHEQLQRSSLNSTIKDAPPVPALPENYRQSHYGGHSVRPSASSAQTSSMSARSSYQTRPSPLSTKSPSPVDSSNSSLNSMNSEGSTNSLGNLEMAVPAHQYPRAFQRATEASAYPPQHAVHDVGTSRFSYPLPTQQYAHGAGMLDAGVEGKTPAVTVISTSGGKGEKAGKKGWFRRKG